MNLGWFPSGGYDYVISSYLTDTDMRFELPIEAYFTLYEHFVIGGKITSYFGKRDDKFSFVPTGQMYFFYFGIKINDNFKIMVEHLCEHGVIPSGTTFNTDQIINKGGGWNKIYIEFKGDIKIF